MEGVPVELKEKPNLHEGDIVLVQYDTWPYWPCVLTEISDKEVVGADGVKVMKTIYRVTYIQTKPSHLKVENPEKLVLFLRKWDKMCRYAKQPLGIDIKDLMEVGGKYYSPDPCARRNVMRMIEEFVGLEPQERIARLDRMAKRWRDREEEAAQGAKGTQYCLCLTKMGPNSKVAPSVMVQCDDCWQWFHIACLRKDVEKKRQRRHYKTKGGVDKLGWDYPDVMPVDPNHDQKGPNWVPWWCPACIHMPDDDAPDYVEPTKKVELVAKVVYVPPRKSFEPPRKRHVKKEKEIKTEVKPPKQPRKEKPVVEPMREILEREAKKICMGRYKSDGEDISITWKEIK